MSEQRSYLEVQIFHSQIVGELFDIHGFYWRASYFLHQGHNNLELLIRAVLASRGTVSDLGRHSHQLLDFLVQLSSLFVEQNVTGITNLSRQQEFAS